MTTSFQEDISEIRRLAEETGKESVRAELIRWMQKNLDLLPFAAQVELLKICGVKVL